MGHSLLQLDVLARKGNVMRLNGIDAELLDRGQVAGMLPFLDYSPDSLSDLRRPFAASRRHGTPRRGRLGVRARGGRSAWTSSISAR